MDTLRFANKKVWDQGLGANVLTDNFKIDAQALGSVDTKADEFKEL